MANPTHFLKVHHDVYVKLEQRDDRMDVALLDTSTIPPTKVRLGTVPLDVVPRFTFPEHITEIALHE